jgi:hypothetical protein
MWQAGPHVSRKGAKAQRIRKEEKEKRRIEVKLTHHSPAFLCVSFAP